MYNKKEIEILNIQIYASIFFLITTIVSIIVTLDQKYYLIYEKHIIKNIDKTIKINRTIIVILLIIFIYINYENKKIKKNKGEDITSSNLELIASYISLIAGLIVLYVVYNYENNTLTLTENPGI